MNNYCLRCHKPDPDSKDCELGGAHNLKPYVSSNQAYWDETCDRCGKRRGSHFAIGHGSSHQSWCPDADGKRDPNSLGWYVKYERVGRLTPTPIQLPSLECPCGINRSECIYHKND